LPETYYRQRNYTTIFVVICTDKVLEICGIPENRLTVVKEKTVAEFTNTDNHRR